MGTVAGTGYSDSEHTREAGVQAARRALAEAGIDDPDLVLLFGPEKHDPKQLSEAVRSVVGPRARLLGGPSMGIITRDYLGYNGFQVAVAVLKSDTASFDLFMASGMPVDEHETGRKLGAQMAEAGLPDDANMVLLYDSVKRSAAEGLELNMATPLLRGIGEALDGRWPNITGVGVCDGMQWNPNHQYFDDRIEQGAAMALLAHGGGLRMDTIIMHGCKPSSAYHTITKAEDNVILGIDGKPALDAIDEITGGDRSWEDYPLFLTLGLNKGDKWGDFVEEDYANRLCMAIDQERRGLVMFEPDLSEGDDVRLMRRTIDDFEYIQQRCEDLFARIGPDRTPVFALYIDCVARASAYCGSDGEEGAEVQRFVGERCPLLGMYSGVEIAKVGSDVQALDWTGVLAVFSEPN